MTRQNLFDTLNEQLTRLVGEGPRQTQAELQEAVHLMLQRAFERLDLVTREEFDTQSEVLARTRQLVEQLEQRLEALEPLESKESQQPR